MFYFNSDQADTPNYYSRGDETVSMLYIYALVIQDNKLVYNLDNNLRFLNVNKIFVRTGFAYNYIKVHQIYLLTLGTIIIIHTL